MKSKRLFINGGGGEFTPRASSTTCWLIQAATPSIYHHWCRPPFLRIFVQIFGIDLAMILCRNENWYFYFQSNFHEVIDIWTIFFLFNEILKYYIKIMYNKKNNNKEIISNSIFSSKNWFKNSNMLSLNFEAKDLQKI